MLNKFLNILVNFELRINSIKTNIMIVENFKQKAITNINHSTEELKQIQFLSFMIYYHR